MAQMRTEDVISSRRDRRVRRPVPDPDPELAAYIAGLPEHPSMEARVAAVGVLLEILARRGEGRSVARG